ncbi:uncharacterized protein N7482_010642 [Penicillium canariense]|uniref:Beta-ketoacyl-[acyl-carrier-protein] synthase I n=1 Tax=Penicillium canariense TaxID=189055 RepID=A0A9W9HMI2_9EURO|nr:uncharacterized protein N7482_010642 [Penicillium canariense]KAJ5151390.1 hypothetical protein N7482_010642 [Penicillium canariense]
MRGDETSRYPGFRSPKHSVSPTPGNVSSRVMHVINSLSQYDGKSIRNSGHLSTVPWTDQTRIETQDVLFAKDRQIARFVELGPSATLTNMAAKTQAAQYENVDSLLGLQRSFLSSVDNAPQVRYHYESRSTLEEEAEEEHTISSDVETPAQVIVPAVAAPPSSCEGMPATSINDVPMPASQLITMWVAFKLKKPMDKISARHSLKDLSSGKSTLQNELMGDLTEQFGSVPDGAEDMPISTLADALQPQSSGQVSQAFSEMIARWISSILPPKFGLNGMRRYLEVSWGLGPSRQMSVIVFAMTQSIANAESRLSSIAAAQSMLDDSSMKYGAYSGLNLQKVSAPTKGPTAAAAVDSETLDKLNQDQKCLANLQHQALMRYLGVDDTNHGKLLELESQFKAQMSRLSLWTSEYGVECELAIRPTFDENHLRHFSFWWNQTRMDVCRLYHDPDCLQSLVSSAATDLSNWNSLRRIANRSNRRTLDLVSGMVTYSTSHKDKALFAVTGSILTNMIMESLALPPRACFAFVPSAPRTTVNPNGSVAYSEVPRLQSDSVAQYAHVLQEGQHTTLKTQASGTWGINLELTAQHWDAISRAQQDGLSFHNKVALITGAGLGSIGAELAKKLLMGGATVIVTTSRSISRAQGFYRAIYRDYGARDSELFVLPFNQASVKDCKDLVDYIYSDSGLGRNIDVLIPFAAIPEDGAEIDQLGPKSEVAHRLMLTNVLRLMGNIVQQKTDRGLHFRPTQVLVPLSPNHGTFGGDGLYSESKLGLESLLNRFASESWNEKISICGVIIGWTRGTGLMESNDILAETVEANGVLTFSQEEMALNILSLLTPDISAFCEDEAIVADFGGGLQRLQGLKKITTEARATIREEQQCNKAIFEEDTRMRTLINPPHSSIGSGIHLVQRHRRSRLQMNFPSLPNYNQDLKDLRDLEGMVDLSSTVVVVGYSELGPWGNSRTRWQMESQRKLAQEGYIEMAWIMGLIKHFDGPLKSGEHFVGWVDTQSGEPVSDDQVAEKYHTYMLDHAGIRLIEPEALGGYDPMKKEFMQEIAVEEDLPPFECTRATANAFQAKHGEHLSIQHLEDSDTVRVQIKAGAHLWVPKIVPLASSVVAGLLPTGWNAARYGIPDDIVGQVDNVTLYTLCCVAEAFLSAGIENPLEVFTQIHLAEIGNFIGSSLGGTDKNREMFHDVRLDKRVQGDVLQETNLNTPAAWVNMLLLGSSGPIKTPVGACATSLESMDLGIDSISSGKTRMCLVGGTDNLQEDESYAFSTMKATVDATKQFAEGRQPAEFSRPTAETRAGFLEAQGCGVQLICNAETAIEMGLPIYAVVAGSTMASDKISRSVPAPGKGLLTFARETTQGKQSPLLDLKHRRAALHATLSRVSQAKLDQPQPSSIPANVSHQVNNALTRQMRRHWGNQFRVQNPEISPLRASLAVFGLTVDDIGIVSLHGTSTKANDINEPETINTQMSHLGRKGPPLIAVCQKSITGHPKAAAAAWMLNGCLQMLQSGLVPGNFNCDNIDPALQKFEHLAFPTETMRVPDVKAFLLNSFGFGQKGAQMVGVAPKYLFATLGSECYAEYARKYHERVKFANRAFAKAVMSNSIVKAHSHPPYQKDNETSVLLDPLARARIHPETREIYFDPANLHGDPIHLGPDCQQADTSGQLALVPPASKYDDLSLGMEAYDMVDRLLRSIGVRSPPIGSIGIDIESTSEFSSDDSPTFLARNYTRAERELASRSRDPHTIYVSRWCAKEAVFKSMGVMSHGAGAAMDTIEICNNDNGSPRVKLHGRALRAAHEAGITNVLLSISHGHDTVIAVAVSQRAASTVPVSSIALLDSEPPLKGVNEYVEEIVVLQD